MQLLPLQDREAYLEMLVDKLIDIAQVDSKKFSVNILKSMQCGFSVSRYAFVSSFKRRMSVRLLKLLIVLPFGALFINLKYKLKNLVTGALGPAHPVELHVLFNDTKE